MKRVSLFAFAAVSAACAAQGPSAESEPAYSTSAVAVDAAAVADAIRSDVAYLADDERAGREAGAPGYDAAASYVAARMAAIGLAPSVDGAFKHAVRLRTVRRDMAQMSFVVGDETLAPFEDFLSARSAAAPFFAASGPLVFVKYGVVDPRGRRDDYAGVDVAGKIVVAFSGAPDAFDSEERAYLSSSRTKRALAAARGAIGMVTIRTPTADARAPWSRLVSRAAAVGMSLADSRRGPGDALPSATLSRAGARKAFAGAPFEFDDLYDALAGDMALPAAFELRKEASFKGASTFGETASENVVGLIEGADPKRRDEVIVLTAHLDHVGAQCAIGASVDDPSTDCIHNGALDNAIGVAAMLEAARMLSNDARRGAGPRRSVAFAALTAEEKGLLGAEAFAADPPLGARRVAANVNLDMPVLLFDFTHVVAFGAERSSLGPAVRAAAEEMGLGLAPDPLPDQGLFLRSDHYRFVEQGVPSVFLALGFENGGEAATRGFLAKHYHRPSDDVTLPIDYDAAARFAILNAKIARRLADAETKPHWREGDFFGDLFAK